MSLEHAKEARESEAVITGVKPIGEMNAARRMDEIANGTSGENRRLGGRAREREWSVYLPKLFS